MTSTVEAPTGLKGVIDVIPSHCYEQSAWRAGALLARDVVLFGVAITGLIITSHPLLLVLFGLLAGVTASGLFVLGHDAAHQSLFASRRANNIVARFAMLPSLHATEVWIYGHNRVHHGHTLRQGMDFVWHPTTPDEWAEMGRLARLRHRFEWGPFGAGAYYLRNVWWNKMVRFTLPERWAKAMRRDQAIVAAYALVPLVVGVALQGPATGLWTWFKIVVVPFLLFCQGIGWVVYVHHIHPEIRWWPRREWNSYRGQVEGTTVMHGPPGWDLFLHWIMVHLPHHVDMRIPCYRLNDATAAIAKAFPGEVRFERISPRSYLRSTSECKLHDFATGQWSRYPSAASTRSA